MTWHYAFVACESAPSCTPREVFERQRLKGNFERHFSEVLTDLDLHHPPCLALNANRMFYAIASLAHNLQQGLKLLRLDDDQQSWRNRTIIRNVRVVPATQVVHAKLRRLKICAPGGPAAMVAARSTSPAASAANDLSRMSHRRHPGPERPSIQIAHRQPRPQCAAARPGNPIPLPWSHPSLLATRKHTLPPCRTPS